jgi:hypothetical protein
VAYVENENHTLTHGVSNLGNLDLPNKVAELGSLPLVGFDGPIVFEPLQFIALKDDVAVIGNLSKTFASSSNGILKKLYTDKSQLLLL